MREQDLKKVNDNNNLYDKFDRSKLLKVNEQNFWDDGMYIDQKLKQKNLEVFKSDRPKQFGNQRIVDSVLNPVISENTIFDSQKRSGPSNL